MSSTIFWNSSRTRVIVSALVHAAPSPSMTDRTSALMTGMICGISSWNITSGSSLNPSISDTIDRWGIIPYPAAMDPRAARTEEAYAITIATPSMREALFPSLVMDGAMKPIIISGTQKVISSPRMYLTVTTTFINASFAASPAAMPIITPSISLAGRLFMILFIDVSPISLFILQSSS